MVEAATNIIGAAGLAYALRAGMDRGRGHSSIYSSFGPEIDR